jgi:GntR family transcriptional regulator, vanillate catabolism transcriptional regulator
MNKTRTRRSSENQTLTAELGIRDLILTEKLAPGERVSELAMVDALGVSRTPVRAALSKLASEGLLSPIPSGGYEVRRFSDSDIRDAIELRGTLEGLAARRAAENGVSPEHMVELRDVIAQIDLALTDRQNGVDFSSYVEHNQRFHELIMELSGSSVIREQYERVLALPFAGPSAFAIAQSVVPQSLDTLIVAQSQHKIIADSIENREGARAEAMMREHARLARSNLDIIIRADVLKVAVAGLQRNQTVT